MDRALFAEIILRITNILSFIACAGILFYLPFIISDLKKVKPICHINFWISLILLHISFCSFLIASFIFNFFVFITPKPNSPAPNAIPWIVVPGNYIGCFAAGFQLGSILAIFFERLIATFYYQTYEGSKKMIFIIVSSILVLICGLFNGYIWNSGVSYFVNAGTFYFFDVLSAFLILILFKLNQRLRRLKNSSNIVLSHRYQIYENLRMIRHVFPMVMWGSLGLVLGGGTSMALTLFCPWMVQNAAIIGCYYYSILNIFSFFAYSHMLLRQTHKREYILSFIKKCLCFGVKISPEITQRRNQRRRNAFGEYVVAKEKKVESDMYFNMLKSEW